MINFTTLQGLTIPEGVVTSLSINGQLVWTQTVADPQEQYWVPFDESKILWMGETVSNNSTGPEDYVLGTDLDNLPTEDSDDHTLYQYRITVDDAVYIIETYTNPVGTPLEWDGGRIKWAAKGYFKVTFNDSASHTFKVESWTGTNPYVAP